MTHNVSAVVLAAGQSRRMGQAKPLLPLGDKTVLQQVLASLASAGLRQIYAVLGPHGEPVAESLADCPVTIIWNRAPQSEMADSLRAVLPHLPTDGQGVLVCLGDQPLVAPETCQRLVDMHRVRPEAIIQPRKDGRRGHPVLLPQSLFRDIAKKPTLRDVLAAHSRKVYCLDLPDLGILVDMDTPADYRQVLRLWKSRQRSPESA